MKTAMMALTLLATTGCGSGGPEWLLWTETFRSGVPSHTHEITKSFATRAACEAARTQQAPVPDRYTYTVHTCWPSTIDPRGKS